MTINPEVNDFLMAQSGKSFPFDNIGDCAVGTIVSADMRQQTDVDTGEKLTWTDGTPRMQLVVTLQTEEHTGDDDDGIRTLYAKGGRFEAAEGTGTSMKDAIAKAVRDGGGAGLNVGDRLWVAYSGNGVRKNRAFNAPKLYEAKFERNVQQVSARDLFAEG